MTSAVTTETSLGKLQYRMWQLFAGAWLLFLIATVADIAARLFLSEGTVRNHLSTAIQKMGTRNRIEAARLAQEKGWLDG